MRIPRRGNIRSHRARKRKIVAPWIVATAVTALVAATLTTGFYLLVRSTCDGSVEATIVASASTATLLETFEREWAKGEPAVAGKCASVEIESRESADVVATLGQTSGTKGGGTPPDVWIPESTAWIRQASASNPEAAKVFPPRQPSLARSAAVIAMPRPMAQAMGWPKAKLTWRELVTEVAADPSGWGRYGKPEWGAVKIGTGDPSKSTGTLLALLALAGRDAAGKPTEDGLAAIGTLKQKRAFAVATTDDILSDLGRADKQGADEVLRYVSAFPALETDVLAYNERSPTVPLVAIYPGDGVADADNPYVVLRASWSDQNRQRVAEDFLRYAQSGQARDAFIGLGFRPPDRSAEGDISEENGLLSKIPPLPDPPPAPETVSQAVAAWAA